MQSNLLELPQVETQVLDNLATAVLVFGADMRLYYLNQMAEALLAVSARHVLGELPEAWMTCYGESVTHLLTAARTGQPLTKRGIALVLADRTQVTVDCTVIPVHNDQVLTHTIVELQQIDRHLRISREERLLSQQALTRDLIRGLAHEIKNPLGGLRGAAQLLQAELPDPELREYTSIIIDEADRLQELVNRMLGPNRRPIYRALNLHNVLERVRALVVAEVGERIRIERDYDPSIPELIGDMDQLIQAVLNIVRNATRVLGESGTILLRTRIQRQFTIGNHHHKLVAQIDVVDDGPGIPEAIADTLFFPMVTYGTGGAGLGLSIAQSLINQHNGLIECQSRPGETVFSILLPLNTQMARETKEQEYPS